VIIPAVLSALAAVAASWLAWNGARKESETRREHTLIDQIQEERTHWQERAERAEQMLAKHLFGEADD
jgi:hypothetical protein